MRRSSPPGTPTATRKNLSGLEANFLNRHLQGKPQQWLQQDIAQLFPAVCRHLHIQGNCKITEFDYPQHRHTIITLFDRACTNNAAFSQTQQALRSIVYEPQPDGTPSWALKGTLSFRVSATVIIDILEIMEQHPQLLTTAPVSQDAAAPAHQVTTLTQGNNFSQASATSSRLSFAAPALSQISFSQGSDASPRMSVSNSLPRKSYTDIFFQPKQSTNLTQRTITNTMQIATPDQTAQQQQDILLRNAYSAHIEHAQQQGKTITQSHIVAIKFFFMNQMRPDWCPPNIHRARSMLDICMLMTLSLARSAAYTAEDMSFKIGWHTKIGCYRFPMPKIPYSSHKDDASRTPDATAKWIFDYMMCVWEACAKIEESNNLIYLLANNSPFAREAMKLVLSTTTQNLVELVPASDPREATTSTVDLMVAHHYYVTGTDIEKKTDFSNYTFLTPTLIVGFSQFHKHDSSNLVKSLKKDWNEPRKKSDIQTKALEPMLINISFPTQWQYLLSIARIGSILIPKSENPADGFLTIVVDSSVPVPSGGVRVERPEQMLFYMPSIFLNEAKIIRFKEVSFKEIGANFLSGLAQVETIELGDIQHLHADNIGENLLSHNYQLKTIIIHYNRAAGRTIQFKSMPKGAFSYLPKLTHIDATFYKVTREQVDDSVLGQCAKEVRTAIMTKIFLSIHDRPQAPNIIAAGTPVSKDPRQETTQQGSATSPTPKSAKIADIEENPTATDLFNTTTPPPPLPTFDAFLQQNTFQRPALPPPLSTPPPTTAPQSERTQQWYCDTCEFMPHTAICPGCKSSSPFTQGPQVVDVDLASEQSHQADGLLLASDVANDARRQQTSTIRPRDTIWKCAGCHQETSGASCTHCATSRENSEILEQLMTSQEHADFHQQHPQQRQHNHQQLNHLNVWRCNICTYDNADMHSPICEICRKPRNSAPQPQQQNHHQQSSSYDLFAIPTVLSQQSASADTSQARVQQDAAAAVVTQADFEKALNQQRQRDYDVLSGDDDDDIAREHHSPRTARALNALLEKERKRDLIEQHGGEEDVPIIELHSEFRPDNHSIPSEGYASTESSLDRRESLGIPTTTDDAHVVTEEELEEYLNNEEDLLDY